VKNPVIRKQDDVRQPLQTWHAGSGPGIEIPGCFAAKGPAEPIKNGSSL